MIFIGTKDEYWPVDAIRHYLDDISGKNFIHYVPNACHGLGGGEQALKALSAFFGRTMSWGPYPLCNRRLAENEEGLSLSVETSPKELLGALLWTADSDDRDFRDETWNSKDLDAPNQKDFEVFVNFPESGYRAFYLDLIYPDPNRGEYTKSTMMFVTNDSLLLDD